MMGKAPQERYPNMAVVVDVLEGLLGVHGDPTGAILKHSRGTIRQAADALAFSPARRLRSRILACSAAIWLGLIVLLFAVNLGGPAFGLLGFGVLTSLATVVASAVVHDSELLHLARAGVLGGGLRSWLIVTTAVLAAIAALWIWGGFFSWVLMVVGGSLVAAFLIFLDRPLAVERKRIVGTAKEILKGLRRGVTTKTLLKSLSLATAAIIGSCCSSTYLDCVLF